MHPICFWKSGFSSINECGSLADISTSSLWSRKPNKNSYTIRAFIPFLESFATICRPLPTVFRGNLGHTFIHSTTNFSSGNPLAKFQLSLYQNSAAGLLQTSLLSVTEFTFSEVGKKELNWTELGVCVSQRRQTISTVKPKRNTKEKLPLHITAISIPTFLCF